MEKCYSRQAKAGEGAPIFDTNEYEGQPISSYILEEHKAQIDAFVKENPEYFAYKGRPMYSYLSKEHREQIDAFKERNMQGCRVTVIWGDSGTGKTWAVRSLFNESEVFYGNIASTGLNLKGLKKGCRILVLDDLNYSYIRKMFGSSTLKICGDLKDVSDIIITTNEDPSSWDEEFGATAENSFCTSTRFPMADGYRNYIGVWSPGKPHPLDAIAKNNSLHRCSKLNAYGFRKACDKLIQ